MLKKEVKSVINSLFNKVVHTSLLINRTSNHYLFHKYSPYETDKKKFIGYSQCGPLTYIIHPFIKKIYQKEIIKPLYTCYGYGKYSEDHICLLLSYKDEKLIIDPTYKQFLICPFEKDETVHKFISELEPFFVGTKEDLLEIINEKEKILNKTESIDDVMKWYVNNHKTPYKLDLFDCLTNYELRKTKPENVQNAITFLESII